MSEGQGGASAPGTRSATVAPRKTTPYGPMISTAAMTGGNAGIDTFAAHAAPAPAIAAAHSFAT